jgi:hypothetical protein
MTEKEIIRYEFYCNNMLMEKRYAKFLCQKESLLCSDKIMMEAEKPSEERLNKIRRDNEFRAQYYLARAKMDGYDENQPRCLYLDEAESDDDEKYNHSVKEVVIDRSSFIEYVEW